MRLNLPSMQSIEERVDALPSLQKALVFLLTILLLGGAFYFLKYKPQEKEIRRLRSSVQSQEKRLADLKKYAAQYETLMQELAKSEEEFRVLMAFLPDQREIPELLETVSGIGAQEGLENLLFQPQGEQKHEFHATIPVRLDMVGSFHQLGTFLDKISRLDRIIRVEALSLKRRNDSSLQVSCNLQTFRFLEEHERSPAAAGGKK
ncbi:type IV pilus assembly protein PilO [Desulfacinum infernum DSM 9756]|uniref:Type IV pilus assembly protein PilO n=1 Tax=Desulfacinum infernum DSM 9756 TaxID=1121391 RepID=A0A1M4SHL9_9BACT|nr:type 4a pilus biogenesis protein PilO [Desulfacinum infernum]SHE31733.1 type IV pilus assembly protein PilO [Desulfacinum infernum DSM 9756]